MLESLFKGTGTIHEMNVDGAFPEPKLYRPRERYEALKETALYDRERGQWNENLTVEQMLVGTNRRADAQLIGTLVEERFSPSVAATLYQGLKASALFDEERGQWNRQMTAEQELRSTERLAFAQLMGVLIEERFSPPVAAKLYETLKASVLYDRESGQWNWSMTAAQGPEGGERIASVQLLGVLVEAKFNQESAVRLYETLKASVLYDWESGQWNWGMTANQVLIGTNRYAMTQLLGVLIEAKFNPEGAAKLFEALKASPLYESKVRLWNSYMAPEGDSWKIDHWSDVQLLGILVESELLSLQKRPLLKDTPPLPVTRSW